MLAYIGKAVSTHEAVQPPGLAACTSQWEVRTYLCQVRGKHHCCPLQPFASATCLDFACAQVQSCTLVGYTPLQPFASAACLDFACAQIQSCTLVGTLLHGLLHRPHALILPAPRFKVAPSSGTVDVFYIQKDDDHNVSLVPRRPQFQCCEDFGTCR